VFLKVEVAATDDAVVIHNSENPADPPVTLSHPEWQEFLADLKGGAFDRLSASAR
jgi:hypothetical protein